MSLPRTILVTYLEMKRPPRPIRSDRPALTELDLRYRIAVDKLDLDAYLRLYREVGGPFGWDHRLKMVPAALAAYLSSERSRVFVLHDERADRIAGFADFDLAKPSEIELNTFGLAPDYYGQGLGPWLLAHALAELWQHQPSRIWLHTDVQDHPAALRTYLNAGFAIYDQRQEDPADL